MKVKRLPSDPGPAAWAKILPAVNDYASLEGKQLADWLVIGAGFAGLSAARRLRQLHPKDKITLLEARHIAEGPAGRNSGFMIDLPHNLASEDYAGALEADRIQTQMNRDAISFAKAASEEFNFSPEAICLSGKINAAATDKGIKYNIEYAKHLTRLKETHEFLDAKQMRELCGSDYYQQGLFTPGTALLQPALYTRELASGISRLGTNIYENSPVTDLSKSNENWIAATPNGSIEAPKVILAVNGHAESFGHYKRRLMHIYLYASMTRALTDEEISRLGGQDKWAFTPANPMGTTVRKVAGIGGTRLIIRNSFTWAPSLTVSKTKLQTIASIHDRSFNARFPMLKDVIMEYRWGGLLCLSHNNVSAFGELDNGLYSACCQNGLGTTKGTSSGKLVAELASGIESTHLSYLIGQPLPRKLPPEPLASIGANAVMRWGEIKAGKEL